MVALDETGAIHFLPKPFSLKQLAGKVKEVMDAPVRANGGQPAPAKRNALQQPLTLRN